MITSPRGSYAAHAHPSRYDHGPTSGHTLDGFHRDRIGLGWWLAFLIPLALIAFSIGVHHHVG